MEKHEFIRLVEQYKPILRGKWSSVAKRAGIEKYVIDNYLKGYATDPDMRQRIIDAAEAEIKELQTMIQEVS